MFSPLMGSTPAEAAATMTVETVGEGLLTPQQGKARAAFIDFCWDLQLAQARSPRDPALRPQDAVMITDLLSRSSEDVAAQGEALWARLQEVGCPLAPIYSRENMLGFLKFVEKARATHRASEEHRTNYAAQIAASIANGAKLPRKTS